MGVGRGLGVDFKVLDDERTCTPAVVKVLGWCLALLAAGLCRLVVVVGVICSSVWMVSIWFVGSSELSVGDRVLSGGCG